MAKITSYSIYQTCIDIHLSDSTVKRIFFNQWSGKTYYRWKINSPSNSKHTGVYLGVDSNNVGFWVHNHYHVGTAVVTNNKTFTKNKTIYPYIENCTNDWQTVIDKAMQHVMRKERFKPLSYNCQTLVHDVCTNKRESPDAERVLKNVVGTVAGVAAFALLVGALASAGRK